MVNSQVSAACADSGSGSGTLRAHGAVLRSASPVLNALLSAPMKEGTVGCGGMWWDVVGCGGMWWDVTCW